MTSNSHAVAVLLGLCAASAFTLDCDARVRYEISLANEVTSEDSALQGYVGDNIEYDPSPPDGDSFTGSAAASDAGGYLEYGTPMSGIDFAVYSAIATDIGSRGVYGPCLSQAATSQGIRIFYPDCPDPVDLPDTVTLTFTMNGGCAIDQGPDNDSHVALATLSTTHSYAENGVGAPTGWDGTGAPISDFYQEYLVETEPGDPVVAATYTLTVTLEVTLKHNGTLIVQNGEGVGMVSAVTRATHSGKETTSTVIHGGVVLAGIETSPANMEDTIHVQFGSNIGHGDLTGDIDGDGDVDQADFGIILGAFDTEFGDVDYDARADLDHDGDVDQSDLGIFLTYYGNSSC